MTAERPRYGLSVSNVARVFEGGVQALRGVSLRVPAGSLATIVGPSGCGKTTLLRIMGGLDRATEGSIALCDERGSPAQAGSAGIGFAFQEPRLLPWRSVLHNIALPLELRGVAPAERAQAAAGMASLVGLGDALARLPGQLSGGMRMRAAIARALVTEPDILLLDEPFGALDEITRQALDDLLLALWRRRRMTVVMVTHSTTEAVYLGEQVVVLAPGPGRVVHTLQPPFAERTPELRATADFAAVAANVLRALGEGMVAGEPGGAVQEREP